ncbi:hypothetical protein BV25DRAFT_24322 [Artomyces pyxidatus]|uniref:Uncharacterized protein n=1 Tax=Artomyces pyxidatus TaxID=48021 RepID=A0ACB8TJW1_9AGAM|nr:hypothetical protein BV25DRAFT_24322 [Artomyces pyxidatus]
MSSTSSSASSSASSASSSPPPKSPQKRKRIENPVEEASDSDSEDESSASGSDSESEEPVLSHAAKRKQKKASKRTTENHGDSGAVKKEGAAGAKATPGALPKRQNSVWVGNLAFKTTPDALRQFFDGVGEITRIHIPTKPGAPGAAGPARRENRGFAYVDFATLDAKIVAISMSERNLEGRRLLIKDGDDFTGRPAAPQATSDASPDGDAPKTATSGTGLTKTARKILASQKQPPAQTLFLGNLGFEATEDAIRGLFEAHRVRRDLGAANDRDKPDQWIRKVRMGTFEDSGNCKGFAFVDFTTTEHATAALVNPKNHQLNGRKLVVEYASADAVRRGGGGPRPNKREKVFRRDDPESGGPRKKRKLKQAEREKAEAVVGVTTGAPAPVQERSAQKERSASKGELTGDRRERSNKRRAAPGAALALARREQVSIVPSQGKRIVFEA